MIKATDNYDTNNLIDDHNNLMKTRMGMLMYLQILTTCRAFEEFLAKLISMWEISRNHFDVVAAQENGISCWEGHLTDVRNVVLRQCYESSGC